MTLIDQYGQELSKWLSGHLTPAQTKERIQELRTHIELDSAERIAQGESQEDAERLACRTAGSPRVVARQMVRQARGYDSASVWRLTWPLGVAMFFAFVIPYSLLGYMPWYSSIDVLVRWVPFLMLVAFGVRVVKTRRWLVGPMVAWAAVTSVFVMVGSVLFLPPQPTEAQKNAASKALQGALVQVEQEQKTVDAWRAGHPPVGQAPVSESGAVMSSTVYPFIPVSIGQSEPLVMLEGSPDPIESQKRWAEFGEAYAADVHQRALNIKGSMSHVTVSRMDTKGMVWNWVTLWAGFTFWQILILGVVNAGLLVLIRVGQVVQTRREPLFS